MRKDRGSIRFRFLFPLLPVLLHFSRCSTLQRIDCVYVPIQKLGKCMKTNISWRQARNKRETSGTELRFIYCCLSCLSEGVGETFRESRQVNTAFWNRAGSLPTVYPQPGSWKKLYEGWMKPGNRRQVPQALRGIQNQKKKNEADLDRKGKDSK